MTSSDEMLKESLSALMDNQANDLELRRILKQLPEDKEIGATWHRYQLASTLIRRNETALLKLDLSAAISQAIASEPIWGNGSAEVVNVSQRESKSTPIWLRWGGKSALAASVALAILVGAQQFSNPVLAPLAALADAPAKDVNILSSGPVSAEVATGVAASSELNLPESSQVQSAPDGFALPVPMARTVSSQADRVQSLQVQPVSLNQTDWRNDPEVQAQLNQMLLDHATRSAAHGSFGLLPFTRVSNVPADVSLNNAAESTAGKR
ncbi:MAG TPA: sigma-E factor negative regulatory protein [Cellvibrionaceae bacterium]